MYPIKARRSLMNIILRKPCKYMRIPFRKLRIPHSRNKVVSALFILVVIYVVFGGVNQSGFPINLTFTVNNEMGPVGEYAGQSTHISRGRDFTNGTEIEIDTNVTMKMKSKTENISPIKKIKGKVSEKETFMKSLSNISEHDTKEKRLLLTLFTSFKDSSMRSVIEKNTIKNWASLSPMVQPVVFVQNLTSNLTKTAQSYGWIAHKLNRTNAKGTPILKDMFIDVYNNYDSYFVGFANGDILFNDGLVKTLSGLVQHLAALNSTMVIGKRSNYYLKKNYTREELLYKKELIAGLARHSSLFTSDAEDYFILSYHGFPWNLIKDVVIGRPGYDNYLVAMAARSNITLVDATKTITALHQTGSEGKYAGAKNIDSRYNKKLIGRFRYARGSILAARYHTHLNGAKELYIERRHVKKKKVKLTNSTLTKA